MRTLFYDQRAFSMCETAHHAHQVWCSLGSSLTLRPNHTTPHQGAEMNIVKTSNLLALISDALFAGAAQAPTTASAEPTHASAWQARQL